MDLSFHKIDESHDAVCFEFASAEEYQFYQKAVPLEIPQGCVLTTRKGVRNRRPCIYVGVAKVGEGLKLANDGPNEPKAKPAPIPQQLNVPDVVSSASPKDLEVMAARNGVSVTEAWRNKNIALRRADVAKAMVAMNAG